MALPTAVHCRAPQSPPASPDWRWLRDHLQAGKRLRLEHVLALVQGATDRLRREPNVLKLSDPVTIVGDIHGQYHDLLKMLEVGGEPGVTQYLFLGDYVDRGDMSTEVVLLLYALKLSYPDRVWLLRGNHEARATTQAFGFFEECVRKYDVSAYEAIMQSFDALPLACVLNGRFLALHGGLGPGIKDVACLEAVDRFQEPASEGVVCDALWADPADFGGPEPFYPNTSRGCSHYFTFSGVQRFLARTSFLSVIRAHEAQMEGFKMHHPCPETGFPAVITVFSAPNYCGTYGNKGAILQFRDDEMRLRQFHAARQPLLPLVAALEPAGWPRDEALVTAGPAKDGVETEQENMGPVNAAAVSGEGRRRTQRIRNAPCKRYRPSLETSDTVTGRA